MYKGTIGVLSDPTAPKRQRWFRLKKSSVYFFMVLPALLLFFSFHTFPALQGVYYSFTNWRGFGTYEFVGLKNYINLFKDTRVFDAYVFTFKFALVSTVIVNVISLFTAILLNERIKMKKFFRAVYFLPNILSILIVGFIFNYIFTFLFTEVGRRLGIEVLSRSILGQPKLAWIGVVIVAVWQGAALNTLLYLASLQTIPDELYESSSIDGAGKWQQFVSITFPMIGPFFTINMVLAMKNFLMVFDTIMALTGGGPGRATESISLLIYNGGFQGGEFAYQSANAVIYFLFILLVSSVQIRYLQRREVKF